MSNRFLVEDFLAVSDAYCSAVELSDARISTLIFNAGSKIKFLKSGTDLSTGHWIDAMQWFSERWPKGVDVPTEMKFFRRMMRRGNGTSRIP